MNFALHQPYVKLLFQQTTGPSNEAGTWFHFLFLNFGGCTYSSTEADRPEVFNGVAPAISLLLIFFR